MNRIVKGVRRRLRRLLRRAGIGHDDGIAKIDWFRLEDVDALCKLYAETGAAPGSAWDAYLDTHLVLPTWFRHGLDPLGAEYAAQQHRLWAAIVGTDQPYEPAVDEKEHSWGDVDPVRRPGFYVRRDVRSIPAASDHVIATGMLLKHCNLSAGDWALEYGAGFGNSALALARMGVNVDTVDISATFCGYVQQQADHFAVPLRPFNQRFGFNPRPGERYKLIWFYESFHHCVDFLSVVPMLQDILAEGGRIILGGEPVFERPYAAVPYPWGVRLHSEVAVTMRNFRWFELGFTEQFLYGLFESSGFRGRRIECEPSLFGRLYVFERSPMQPVVQRRS